MLPGSRAPAPLPMQRRRKPLAGWSVHLAPGAIALLESSDAHRVAVRALPAVKDARAEGGNAARAYQRYLAWAVSGHDLEDWLEAEQKVCEARPIKVPVRTRRASRRRCRHLTHARERGDYESTDNDVPLGGQP